MDISEKKWLLFDNDGVLVETEHLYMRATIELMGENGFDISRETYMENLLRKNKGVWWIAENAGIPKVEIQKWTAERNERYSQYLANEDIFIPGVLPIIQELHQHYKMAIITSSRKEHFAIIHERTGLLPHFEFVLASGDYPQSKPFPDPYLLALEKANISANQALVIEDSPRGLMAADAAKIESIAIPRGLTIAEDFSLATLQLKSLDELRNILITN